MLVLPLNYDRLVLLYVCALAVVLSALKPQIKRDQTNSFQLIFISSRKALCLK